MGSIQNLTDNEKSGLRHFLDRVEIRFGDNYRYSLLYGSKARGDSHTDSDIDVAVIVGQLDFNKKCEIIDIASDEMLESEIEISPLVFAEDDFLRKKHDQSPILREIMRDMVLL